MEITLSQETDPEIAKIIGAEVLFPRGVYAQYIKGHNIKAKYYFKQTILLGNNAKKAVKCWINSLLLRKEAQLSVLNFFKKYKHLWIKKPDEYKRLKGNIKCCYNGSWKNHQGNNSKDTQNLVEISTYLNMKPWEKPELYARRLMKYDFLIVRILSLWQCQNVGPNPKFWEYSRRKIAGQSIPVFLVETMQDANLCDLLRDRKNLTFEFHLLSSNEVKIEGENYYSYLEKVDPDFRILREDMFWKDKMISNISQNILQGVDFNVGPIEESDEEDGEGEGCKEIKDLDFPPKQWNDFHFSFSEDG